MPAGRPTDYRPEMGEQIIEMMAKGYSLTAACASLGFYRQRAYEWAERHPEFADTIRLAKSKRVLKLERDLLEAEAGPVVTSRIFALKNADHEEWREKVVNENTGPDGGPIKHEHSLSAEAQAMLDELVKGRE